MLLYTLCIRYYMYLYVLKKLSIFELKFIENKTEKLVHGERSIVVCWQYWTLFQNVIITHYYSYIILI